MGWAAELQLAFVHDGAVTRLRRRGGKGPLYVQKPFYPEGGVCHVYLLHPPGGVVGGDSLSFTADVEHGAQVLFTTPAATKFMRSNETLAVQRQKISVASNAFAEWLPQETIVFNEAWARNETLVQLQPGAVFIGCEVTALGRPANHEVFSTGSYSGLVRIERFDPASRRFRPILIDQQRFQGAGAELQKHWGLGGHPVMGSLFATFADADLLASVRSLPAARAGIIQSTLIGEVLMVRCFGSATSVVHHHLRACWAALRPMLLQRKAEPPAIWRT